VPVTVTAVGRAPVLSAPLPRPLPPAAVAPRPEPSRRRTSASDRRRSGRRRGRLLQLGCLVLAVGAALTGWGAPRPWALPAVAVMVLAGELVVTEGFPGRAHWRLAGSAVVLTTALALDPGAWLLPATAGGLAAAALVRRQPRVRWLPELLRGLGALGAALVADRLSRTVGQPREAGAAIGMAVWWAVGQLLAATAAAVATRRRIAPLWRRSARASVATAVVTTLTGTATAVLARHAPAGLLGLSGPAVLLLTSTRARSRAAVAGRTSAAVAQAAAGEQDGTTAEAGTRAVLTAAARVLGGADVTVLLVGPDGAVRYRGDETGVRLRERVAPSAFDEPELRRALGGRGVALGRDADRRPVAAVTVGAPVPRAALLARRPAGAPAFGRPDHLLVEALAVQLASWQLVVSRAEIGADAEPRRADVDRAALDALRDAGRRLATVATGGDEDRALLLARVVDELAAAERAAAALVGGLAAAPSPAEHDDAWTTTGLLG